DEVLDGAEDLVVERSALTRIPGLPVVGQLSLGRRSLELLRLARLVADLHLHVMAEDRFQLLSELVAGDAGPRRSGLEVRGDRPGGERNGAAKGGRGGVSLVLCLRRTRLRSGAARRLLNDVRKFVGQQPPAGLRVRSIATLGERDMFADAERVRAQRIGR